jgi:hypothetical protein
MEEYWERLRRLGLNSLQRRRERYVILYTWNILAGMAPNFESETFRIETHHNERWGRLCKIPPHYVTDLQSDFNPCGKDHFRGRAEAV